MRRRRTLVLVCVATISGACDKSITAPQQSFELTPDTPSLFVGSTIRLEPKAGSTVPTSPLKWSTSDIHIVSVDGNGIITGVSPGTATIRAATRDGSAETTISVISGGSTLRTSVFTTCAIDGSSSLYCWGLNSRGQVGIGSTTAQLVPAKVGSSFTSVSVGWEHACAMSQNVPYCWGNLTAF